MIFSIFTLIPIVLGSSFLTAIVTQFFNRKKIKAETENQIASAYSSLTSNLTIEAERLRKLCNTMELKIHELKRLNKKLMESNRQLMATNQKLLLANIELTQSLKHQNI